MKINYLTNGMLQIDGAQLVRSYRNFAGVGNKFNREGDRNFSILIEDIETADALRSIGYNVKIKPPREEGDTPFMHLPVKVKFNGRGPKAYLYAGGEKAVELDEESIACLDDIDILSADVDIRPFDWEVNGKTGRTAYLQAIHVVQEIDRFAALYADGRN
jgi:hypothetical protein